MSNLRNLAAALMAPVVVAACADPPTSPASTAARFAMGVGQHGPGAPLSIVFTHRPPSGTPVNLWLMNADGSNPQQLTFSDPGVANITPDWSPNGRRIAFTSTRDGDADIYIMDADGGGLAQLTDAPGVDQGPVWSPNGSSIAFYSERDGDFDIYVMDADGSNVRQLTDHPGVDQYPDWSPNGRTIAFQRDGDIHLLDVRDGSTTLVWDDPVFADMPEFSPDGMRLAFMSRSLGGCMVFVVEIADGSVSNLTPRPIGAPLPWCNYFPSWSKNGQQVYFGAMRSDHANGDGEIYVVNADGSGLTRLTVQPGMNSAPSMR